MNTFFIISDLIPVEGSLNVTGCTWTGGFRNFQHSFCWQATSWFRIISIRSTTYPHDLGKLVRLLALFTHMGQMSISEEDYLRDLQLGYLRCNFSEVLITGKFANFCSHQLRSSRTFAQFTLWRIWRKCEVWTGAASAASSLFNPERRFVLYFSVILVSHSQRIRLPAANGNRQFCPDSRVIVLSLNMRMICVLCWFSMQKLATHLSHLAFCTCVYGNIFWSNVRFCVINLWEYLKRIYSAHSREMFAGERSLALFETSPQLRRPICQAMPHVSNSSE